ncbi:hypothetical protein IF1G_02932 [Cordyceps javanica]|uniref:Uncharacterized protein n=1 Tax=Cordyceps javanica TaxID=43265 RepID=A0A545VAU4_9HYPO|nr:hypothetical protein IF1G_02932 [Cordyceps javanica]
MRMGFQWTGGRQEEEEEEEEGEKRNMFGSGMGDGRERVIIITRTNTHTRAQRQPSRRVTGRARPRVKGKRARGPEARPVNSRTGRAVGEREGGKD